MNVDLGTVFEFAAGATGEPFGVTLATLLQCLCIAQKKGFVPPFEADWVEVMIPPILHENINGDYR